MPYMFGGGYIFSGDIVRALHLTNTVSMSGRATWQTSQWSQAARCADAASWLAAWLPGACPMCGGARLSGCVCGTRLNGADHPAEEHAQ